MQPAPEERTDLIVDFAEQQTAKVLLMRMLSTRYSLPRAEAAAGRRAAVRETPKTKRLTRGLAQKLALQKRSKVKSCLFARVVSVLGRGRLDPVERCA